MMSMEDIDWLNRCKQDPGKYRIDVDNDCIFVTDLHCLLYTSPSPRD